MSASFEARSAPQSYPTGGRKPAMAELPDKSARPVVRPAKAGMFGRKKACRGNSEAP